MTAKEYFSQIPLLDKRIDAKLEQLDNLKAQATKVSAVISDMPRNDSANLQQLEASVAKLIDLEDEITDDIDRLIDTKREALESINALDDYDQQMILEFRYFCNKPWDEIMKLMKLSSTTVYRLHGIALKNVQIPKSGSKCY